MGFLNLLFPAGDKRIFLAWLFLCLMSLAVLWSVTEPIQGPYEQADPGVAKNIFYKQVIWLVVSFMALLAASRFPLRYMDNVAIPLFLFSILLLVLVLFVGPRIGGATRWLALGPIKVQPAEFAKVTFIIMLSSLMARSSESGTRLFPTLVSVAVMLVPMVLVFP